MSEDHWTETLFLRHPEVFLAVHENAWSIGEAQAKDLQRILERFGVPAGGRNPAGPGGVWRRRARPARNGYPRAGRYPPPPLGRPAKSLPAREGGGRRATCPPRG